MTNGETDDMMYLGVDLGEDVMGEDNMTDLLNADMLMWAASSPRRLDDDPTGSRDGSPARQLTHDAPAYGHGGGDDTVIGISLTHTVVTEHNLKVVLVDRGLNDSGRVRSHMYHSMCICKEFTQMTLITAFRLVSTKSGYRLSSPVATHHL